MFEPYDILKYSNRERLNVYFGLAKAKDIIECIKTNINSQNFQVDVRACLKTKGYNQKEEDEIISIMGFITVG